ncbi:hypothetical protein PIB30_103969 [Stylosanthes scabra]|uniref:Uncharacterized protein n=1 Tax=Stylosanthes scabra TaxID=79078 RepID=A0ABU6W192_9FABA|nr:hypothetical protein [Stylosanthes scabra]
MDAILAQNKAMAQQLSAMNKKLEKLEVSAIGAQSPPFHTCGICGGPHESNICSMIHDVHTSAENWGDNQGSNNRPYQPPFQRQQQYQPLTSTPQQSKPPQATNIKAT